MKDLAKALALGGNICFCLVAPTILGVLADKHFHTEPLWVIVGVIVGLVGAFQTLRGLVK